MSDEKVIVYSDKTVLKISGIRVRGLNTAQLEKILSEKLNSFVRVIGVTGTDIDMDVYGLSTEQIQKNKDGIIQAVSTAEGITPSDLLQISSAHQALSVDVNEIPSNENIACPRERWVKP